LAAGQHPFATILGCSDSRVPTELVFDQGLGDLFVIRVAGNVIAEDIVGSIEYAGLHLHTRLFVVLGHQGCGAVAAALQARTGGDSDPEGIQSLLRHIEPAIKDVDTSLAPDQQLERAVEANVRWSLEQLTDLPGAHRILNEQKLILTGAVYELDSGRVRWLQEAGAAG
jgi:carbonic anhydrase